MTFDAVIVGGGAAGLSAALMLGRARRRTLLYDDGNPRNAHVEAMHGFLTRDGMPPAEFLRIGCEEIAQYPTVERRSDTVSAIERDDDGFSVRLRSGEPARARRVLLATGVFDALPAIEGLDAFWKRSVFVCPFCDGWEVRDRTIAVYAESRAAMDLAQELVGWTPHVSVCVGASSDFTQRDRRWAAAANVPLYDGRLRRLFGKGDAVSEIELSSGRRVPCEALFLGVPLRQASPLATALGCRLDGEGAIIVDEDFRTDVRGVYAVGDAVGHVHQVAFAVGSGAQAAMALNQDLLCAQAEELMEA